MSKESALACKACQGLKLSVKKNSSSLVTIEIFVPYKVVSKVEKYAINLYKQGATSKGFERGQVPEDYIKEYMLKQKYDNDKFKSGIVNEFDLVEALEKNIIMGAGLDVYDIEPLPENHKLRFLPNALLLPHLGYVTKENYEVFYTQMAENLLAFKEGKPIRVIQMLN